MMALITASNARWRAGVNGRLLLRVAEQDVQELVADHGLDVLVVRQCSFTKSD